jgi:hypothetical protein
MGMILSQNGAEFQAKDENITEIALKVKVIAGGDW